ncbi:MAG: CoA transferase [Lachnospiraceae bacterium]|nr:CoA transferase [Lachnospiraceae bacterium]
MGPLEGLKVVELSTHIAVPVAARIMADWGARVIKIENPSGDPWRQNGKNYAIPTTDEENVLFALPNSNKEFISINLKDEKGRAILCKLLEDADIFLTNVRYRSLKKLGLDHQTIMERFPKLIYYHFDGYGEKGPMKDYPGFDLAAFWAQTGMLNDWVIEGQLPMIPASAFGDMTCATMVALGAVSAYLSALKTGRGRYVTSSLYGTAIWYNYVDILLAQPQYHKYANRPVKKGHVLNPFCSIWLCADGKYIFTGGIDFNESYEKSMKAMGLTDIMDDPKYRSPYSIEDGRHVLYPIFEKVFLTRPADEWTRLFTEADVVCQTIKGAGNVTMSEQAWANGYLTEIDYGFNGYKTAIPTTPVRFEGMEIGKTENAGGIGKDSIKILREQGLSDEQIKYLADQGIIRAIF